jgi:hypothetical protein
MESKVYFEIPGCDWQECHAMCGSSQEGHLQVNVINTAETLRDILLKRTNT